MQPVQGPIVLETGYAFPPKLQSDRQFPISTSHRITTQRLFRALITLKQTCVSNLIFTIKSPTCACSYDNTDLVVVLTMMPEYNDDIAGFAKSLQKDNWGRTTVGWFNFVPNQIDASIYDQEKNEENLKVCLSR